jgi:hypothetical protein
MTLDLMTVLQQAAASDYGIVLRTDDDITAHQLRRKLYNYRERLRSEGNHDYDYFSFIVRSRVELLIVVRPTVKNSAPHVSAAIRALESSERPHCIRARGKSRFHSGFMKSMY